MSNINNLSRTEMKNVIGGVAQTCTLTVSGPNYSNPQKLATNATNGTDANTVCVNLISEAGNGVYHCGYTCGSGNA